MQRSQAKKSIAAKRGRPAKGSGQNTLQLEAFLRTVEGSFLDVTMHQMSAVKRWGISTGKSNDASTLISQMLLARPGTIAERNALLWRIGGMARTGKLPYRQSRFSHTSYHAS